jgi:hypothetical protein
MTRAEFSRRFNVRHYDPVYDAEREAIARLEALAWDAYRQGNKAPITRAVVHAVRALRAGAAGPRNRVAVTEVTTADSSRFDEEHSRWL